jgi:hypothetical protein
MANKQSLHRVYNAMNKPLTIWSVERRLFFLAIGMGAATFNLFGSLVGGILMFVVLYLFARWATVTDPEILRIVLGASKFRRRYDPGKRADFRIERRRHG